MKWILIAWGLTGPHTEGIFDSREVCEGLADHQLTVERAAVRLCVQMDVDRLVSDVVIWNPDDERTLKIRR